MEQKFSSLAVMEAANHSKNSAMEAENHVKHGMSGKVFTFIFMTAIFAVVFISCNKDKPEQTGQVAVNLKTDILPATSILKVANDQWETNDMVGLYMKRTGQSLTTSGAVYGDAANVQMSITGQTLTSNPQVMYPTSGNVDFVAYYPYTAQVDNDYAIVVDVAGQDTGLPVEVLYSDNVINQAPTETAITLDFRYSLAKIELTVSGGANSTLTVNDFANMTVSVEGMYTQAKLQLVDGTFIDHREKQTVSLLRKNSNNSSVTFEILALPTNEELTFLFNVGGIVYRHEMTVNYVAANLYKLGFVLDFPHFPEPTATLLNTQIVPRTENPQQNFSVDATMQMTLTTEASEVTFLISGTGKMTIDWGDGSPSETYTLIYNLFPTYTYSYFGTSTRVITITGENITHLNCGSNTSTGNSYNNQLISLDVSKNTALVHLACNNNQLSELDVSKNNKLSILNCYNNQLTRLDLSNNTELILLLCGSNQLKNLDLSKNTTLSFLDCTFNELTTDALDVMFETLHSNTAPRYYSNIDPKTILIFDNPGEAGADRSIATSKGWTVQN